MFVKYKNILNASNITTIHNNKDLHAADNNPKRTSLWFIHDAICRRFVLLRILHSTRNSYKNTIDIKSIDIKIPNGKNGNSFILFTRANIAIIKEPNNYTCTKTSSVLKLIKLYALICAVYCISVNYVSIKLLKMTKLKSHLL